MENPKGSTTGTSTPKPPKPRWEWSNPALKSMGIKRIRLPTRNWSIFWAVTGSITGSYFYDRREKKKARQYWKDRVSHLAAAGMSPLELPRKVTVYVAPPPADFLDLGLAHFRHYIKPILTAAAVDYELKSESRQGEIRAMVAEEIRQKRRRELALPEPERELEEGELTPEQKAQDEAIKTQLQKHLVKDKTGGVICVGRGPYKEYMAGLQEGWLGPLYAPVPAPEVQEEPKDVESFPAEKTLSESSTTALESSAGPAIQSLEENLDQAKDVAESTAEVVKDLKTEEEAGEVEKKKETKKPVVKPYIGADEYANAQLPAEFSRAELDPIAAISFPHLIGFLAIPARIYRFFTQRHLADKLGEATVAVVIAQTRPFDKNDVFALIEEEDEWPKNWKKKGLGSGSEWMQDLTVDDRVAEHLQIYSLPQDGEGSFVVEQDMN